MTDDHYPDRAGYTEPETSKDAADAIESSGKAPKLREEILRTLSIQILIGGMYEPLYEPNEMTADELAAEMGESVFSVRPRVAELHRQGLVEKTGERRPSSNGRSSHVWRLTR